MFTKEEEVEYARIVARSWIDPKFRDEVIAHPKEILRSYRISVPDHVEISVKPGSDRVVLELGLPPKPPMKDEQIAVYAQGDTAAKTRSDAADKTRADAPDHTRDDAPDRTRDDAPDRTRDDAPDRTRGDAPKKAHSGDTSVATGTAF